MARHVKIGKIISYIFIIGLFCSSIAFLAYSTNGFTSDINTFFIECNDEKITSIGSGFETSKTDPLIIKVNYNFPLSINKGYKVKVVPNQIPNHNFDFIINNDTYSFQAEPDLSSGFTITYETYKFYVTPKGDLTTVIQSIYPDFPIENCNKYAYTDMFTLIISSLDETTTLYVHFCISDQILDLTLDKEVIVF